MIKLKSLLLESSKDDVRQRLGCEGSPTIHQINSRVKFTGYQVSFDKLYDEMSTISKRTMDTLLKCHQVRHTLVGFIEQHNGNEAMVWSIEMYNGRGSRVIWERAESAAPGFGQSYVSIDNGRKTKMTEYLTQLTRETTYELSKEIKALFKSLSTEEQYNYIDVYTTADLSKIEIQWSYKDWNDRTDLINHIKSLVPKVNTEDFKTKIIRLLPDSEKPYSLYIESTYMYISISKPKRSIRICEL